MLIAADVRRPSTVTEEEPGSSVSDTLQDFTWDSDETAAYETAVEVINAAIGAYSGEIAVEEAKAAPDQALIASLRADQAEFVQEQRRLDPEDHDQIAKTRQRFARLAREAPQRAGHV